MSLLVGFGLACGGPGAETVPPSARAESAEPGVVDHPLIATWNLRREPPSGIRLALAIDSAAGDSVYGRMAFYMAGDAGMLEPDEWGPLRGTMRGEAVTLRILEAGRAPPMAFDGVLAGDSIALSRFAIWDDVFPGPWWLVRER